MKRVIIYFFFIFLYLIYFQFTWWWWQTTMTILSLQMDQKERSITSNNTISLQGAFSSCFGALTHIKSSLPTVIELSSRCTSFHFNFHYIFSFKVSFIFLLHFVTMPFTLHQVVILEFVVRERKFKSHMCVIKLNRMNCGI